MAGRITASTRPAPRPLPGRAPAVAPVKTPQPLTATPGFVVGANLPWISYGEFGANAWQPQGGLHRPEQQAKLAATLDRLHAVGVTNVRWWLLCDGRAGVRFAPDGTPQGLDASFFKDMDAAIAALKARGMTATFTVLDFGWLKAAKVTNGVQTGGHADVIRDPAKRQAYLDRVLKPILERYGKEPAVEAWDLINEPEWEVFGQGSWNPFDVKPQAMRDFVRASAAYVHRYAQQEATVGSASTRWLPLVQGLGLDFYAPHWYDHFEGKAPLGRSVQDLHADRPVILGEYPTKGSQMGLEEIVRTVQGAGYKGAYAWSVTATDEATDFQAAEPALKRLTTRPPSVLGRDQLVRSK